MGMSDRVTRPPWASPRVQARLEAVLLQHTDVLAARRRVLAIAPTPEVFEVLESLAQLDRRYAMRSAPADPAQAAESFDVVVADTRRCSAGERESVHELARVLCPGGRAIIAVAPACVATLRRRLADEGFLVALAAADDSVHILVAIRGEFAADDEL
jgi:hypothetical protein